MSEVISLNVVRADRQNDNTLLTPVEALRDVIAKIGSGETVCDKLLVLHLDTGADGDRYDFGFNACNMKASEMLALLDVAKVVILQQMNFIPEPT